MSAKGLVVVTGASSGIGKAIAQSLSAQGHPLLLVARRLDRLKELDLPQSLCLEVDVTDSRSFANAIAQAEEKFGPVDCLVNNAGMMLLGQIDQQDASEWNKMFQLNVIALLNNTQIVLKGMKQRRQGTVINISSIAGKKTFPNHAAYCGTKFAVSAMTENMREEYAKDGVRFISICPGAVETELLSHTTSSEIKAGYEDWKDGMGGALVPEDIASAVAFAYQQPPRVSVREIIIAATAQQP